MPNEYYYVWIRYFKNIGYIELNKIFKKLKIKSLKELYNYSKGEEAKKFLNKEIKEKAKEMYYRLIKSNIKIITLESKEYPKKLKNIYSPPLVLFVRGNYKLLYENIIAIVGSRECSSYGKKVAYSFSKKLAKNNYVIISGLAKGIDSYAHKGAIYNSLSSTIAVIGTGLNICYPKENILLDEIIIKRGGCIVSEYLLDEGPKKYHFPMRNRIVAGLCDKLIVIEARNKSGALITVDMALENGKEVYALPGNVTSKFSFGTNEMIKEGCSLIDNVDFLIK